MSGPSLANSRSMADRVIVLREGRIAGTFDRAGLTAETLVATATGNRAEAA